MDLLLPLLLPLHDFVAHAQRQNTTEFRTQNVAKGPQKRLNVTSESLVKLKLFRFFQLGPTKHLFFHLFKGCWLLLAGCGLAAAAATAVAWLCGARATAKHHLIPYCGACATVKHHLISYPKHSKGTPKKGLRSLRNLVKVRLFMFFQLGPTKHILLSTFLRAAGCC